MSPFESQKVLKGENAQSSNFFLVGDAGLIRPVQHQFINFYLRYIVTVRLLLYIYKIKNKAGFN